MVFVNVVLTLGTNSYIVGVHYTKILLDTSIATSYVSCLMKSTVWCRYIITVKFLRVCIYGCMITPPLCQGNSHGTTVGI